MTMASQNYGTTWWGQRWLNALSGIDYESRIPRGKTYANTGKVFRLEFDTHRGIIKARVKGNYDPFYSVQLKLPRFSLDEIDRLVNDISKSPVILANLSARKLDPKIEELAEKRGISIFPKRWDDLQVSCSCPDWAVPCKHIAAVIYKISQEIDANPFILFELKGFDLVAELKEHGVDFEQVEETEMPTWKQLLQKKGNTNKLPLGSLKKLSFAEIPPLLDSVMGVFAPSPAGYTGSPLRDVLQKVLVRAQKKAVAALKDKTDRDVPSWNEDEALVRLDSWGRVHFAKSLKWTVYPNTGSGTAYSEQIRNVGDELTDEGVSPENMFSGAIDHNALQDAPEAMEALYDIWLLATKLVMQGAIIPQIYEPIDENFIIRWIPAFMSREISRITDEAGRALLSLPEDILLVDRRPEELSGRVLAEALLGAFIDGYVIDSYTSSTMYTASDPDALAPEIKALLLREVVDTADLIAGEHVRMGLESWLSPLYLEDLKVKPVVILQDLTLGSRLSLDDLVDNVRTACEPDDEENAKEKDLYVDTARFPEFADDFSDEQTEVEPEIETELMHEQKSGSGDLFSNETGIGISMGFNRVDTDGTPDELFIPLKDVLEDPQYGKIRFECMRTISRLSAICPQLSSLLENHGGEGVIGLDSLASVILSSIPAMKLLGVRLIIPRALNRVLYPKASMKIGLKPGDNSGNNMISLMSMIDFDWSIALGDHGISDADFERLLQYEGKVVRFGSSFVYVDPETMVRIGKKLALKQQPSKQRLIAAALTGRFGDNSVYITKELKDALKRLLSEKALALPKDLNAKLRPYQERGYSWLVRNMHTMMGSIIADDMGLGKTLQVISAIEKLREDGELDKKQVLIVVPTSVLVNWQRELKKFAPKLTFSVFYSAKRKLDPSANIILTTYGTLRSSCKVMAELNLRLIAIDEAQTIKNSSSMLFNAVRSLKADSMIAMSGTPVENRLMEYWSIMDFVNPGLLGNVREFKKEFSDPIERNRDADAAKRLRRVTAPFIMRRLKSDKSVISDLPEKITTDTYCTLTPVQVALYQAQLDESMRAMEQLKVGIARSAVILNMIDKLKKICNAPQHFSKEEPHKGPEYSGKAEVMFGILDELHKAHRKVLIFTQFKEMGTLLQQWIKDRTGYEPQFIHGGVHAEERAKIVENFQSKRSERILLLTLKAAGTGLNLTEASAVIHYDLWWNPAVESQATDRAYRIGQKQNVQVYRLICANSFEEKINDMIESKKELAEMTVNVGEKWIGDMSNRQLEEIFTLSDHDDAPKKRGSSRKKAAS